MANKTADCPAIPDDGIGAMLPKNTPLYPVSLKEALSPGGGSNLCVLACNIILKITIIVNIFKNAVGLHRVKKNVVLINAVFQKRCWVD